MMLSFLGGASEVGRSAILLRDKRSFLLDFGVKLDDKTEYPLDAPRIDACILSHAHLDHCGYVPAIYKDQFMPTLGTEPTLGLADLLLQDSIGVAKKRHVNAGFSKRNIKTFKDMYRPMRYRSPHNMGEYTIELFDAGHICGSAITKIERSQATDNRSIVYTGDFKVQEQLLHGGAETVKSDLLIMESTYATREHPDRQETMRRFVGEIKEVLDNGGNALLPAFAVGRSQELLAILYKNGLASSTYIDGMAKAATSISINNSGFLRNGDSLRRAAEEATLVDGPGTRTEALSGPSVILTTAGMLNGGPVMHYIKRLAEGSRIFLTGYQIEGTNGRRLLETGTIVDEGETMRIPFPVSFFDFSAHAGMDELYDYVRRSSPSTIVCVHGSEENTAALAEGLRQEGGFEAYAPHVGDTIKLGD